MTERYESPEVNVALTKEEIHKRYQDAALVIHKVIVSLRVACPQVYFTCKNVLLTAILSSDIGLVQKL